MPQAFTQAANGRAALDPMEAKFIVPYDVFLGLQQYPRRANVGSAVLESEVLPPFRPPILPPSPSTPLHTARLPPTPLTPTHPSTAFGN